jgi:hypothetical protein
MDRSFLSRPEVVAASRDFVCVRLATYEDKEEGAFLKSFGVTRSGELENTVFAVLSPDGERELARAARSTRQTFGDAERMAQTLRRIAADYRARGAGRPPSALPLVANVRLALDVAACDNRPLVVLYGKDAKTRQELEARLRPLAWGDALLGRFIYAAASEAKELAAVQGATAGGGVVVVQPDRFGLKGTVLSQAAADAPTAELETCLKQGAARHRPQSESFGVHVRDGRRKGLLWETVIPVTDPMERQARERGRSAPGEPGG